MTNHILNITWGKAFGEIYCHHASLTIPSEEMSLFQPEIVRISLTIRTNNIEKGVISGYSDKSVTNFLPCKPINGSLLLPLNSTPIIDGISLNSWTSLKGGDRGTMKEFPICISYKIGDNEETILSFNHEKAEIPYIISEPQFVGMKDGDKVDVTIKLD